MATEKRLIYSDALYETIANSEATSSDGSLTISEIAEFIEAQPTVDAVEVVHGHWCWEGKFKACSECGSYVEWNETLGANFWKFCPYCGAKMDGGADNGI